MKNPFVYGKEVAGANFCNRKKEVSELCRDVVNSQNVIIFSQRRLGKTSLIKQVFESCRKKGIVTIYVDLYAVLTEGDLVRIYAKAIAETLLGNVSRRLKEAAKLFQRIRPKFSMDPSGQVSYSIDIDKKEILPSLEDVLESVGRYAEGKSKKAVVCFDEFQQIRQFETDKIEKTMRSVFQKQRNIAYIFMGSKKHLIVDMFNNPSKPFYRSAKPFPLGRIQKSELLPFIREKFKSSKRIISDRLIEEMIDMCELHPYYIQYLCHIIWEKTIDRKNIARGDFNEGLELLLNRESSTYEATWDLLTVKQRQVLMALARVLPGEKLFSSEFLQKHNLGSASTLQRTLQSLIEKDLVDKEGNIYTIADVFFKEWLSRM